VRGRRPKPTEQRRLEGNPGRRPLNADEPSPPISPSLFDDPPELATNPIALAEWRRLAAAHPLWITDVDRGLLLESCVLYARMREADDRIERTGGAVIQTKAGNIIQNPYLPVANRAFLLYKSACVELGLTPSARSRVRSEGDSDPLPTAGAGGEDFRSFLQ